MEFQEFIAGAISYKHGQQFGRMFLQSFEHNDYDVNPQGYSRFGLTLIYRFCLGILKADFLADNEFNEIKDYTADLGMHLHG